MSVLDIAIVLTVLLAVYVGSKRDPLRQLFVAIGLLLGLLVAVLLYTKLAFLSEYSGRRALILAALTIAVAILCYDLFLVLGERVRRSINRGHYRKLSCPQRILSAGIVGVTCLALWWLSASMFSGITLIQSHVQHSRILAALEQTVRAPALFRRISHLVEPFGSPQVFVGNEPAFAADSPVVSEEFRALDRVVGEWQTSVVKVGAWGCGSGSLGSGFLTNNSKIVTNAHVIAGADRISVQDGNGVYVARVIYFNPQLDIAVLATSAQLSGRPLQLQKDIVRPGTIAAAVGYPSGKNLMTEDAVVLRAIHANGYDIYDRQQTTRSIYAVRASIMPGNSGGPLISASGTVIGLVFGHAVSEKRTGYAITSDQVMQALATIPAEEPTVANGSCAR
jgi:S1-C subfamily serine protease